MKKDNAFTGLEAAIVLIAFVVVAAVFSYVLLGAGFFATQKAQEVTYAGIQQTTSNMMLIGQVYGNVTKKDITDPIGTPEFLTTLNLILGVPEGAQPQDVAQISFLFSNDTGLPLQLALAGELPTPATDFWDVTAINGVETTTSIGATGAEAKLYPGDRADIEITISPDHKITSKRDQAQPSYSRSFTLEIKPRIGASYLISRTLSTGFSNGPLY